MAEYVKVDEFVNIAKECGGDPKVILEKYPDYFTSFSSLKNRLGRLRRKGLLPLASGNSVSSGEILKGTSTLYDGQGNIKQQWVKSDTDKEQLLDAFKDAVQGILDKSDFKYKKIKQPEVVSSDLMTVYPIGDAHVGMLAHAAETGQDHDLAISKARHINAIKLAVKSAPDSEEAFIIDVGDWFHADNGNNRTPRGGNALDVDGRFHKVIDTGFEIATEMIKAALKKHKTVHWRSAEGEMIALL